MVRISGKEKKGDKNEDTEEKTKPFVFLVSLAIAQSIHQGLGLRFPGNDLTLS